MTPTVRPAREDDYDDVVAFAREVWSDRPETTEYIPDIFRQWVRTDGPTQRTVVADVDGTAVGLCQGSMLTDHEAWLQGMRVDPGHRGEGLGLAMVEDIFEWARDRGAAVARNMVFSWNDAGLGQSVAAGFEPETAFRFAHPEPAERSVADVTNDPAAAWRYWTASDGRKHLAGLVHDPDQPWALSELTRERLFRLADEQAVFAVGTDGDTRGMACRSGTTTDSGGEETIAEYAVGTWTDREAAAALFDAIRDDAAALNADRSRVLIPETARHVTAAAAARADPADWPDFVLAAPLD
jgi:GNAT superfamily N-acetyltransferase